MAREGSRKVPHERRLHEQVGILALALRAGLASRVGASFAIWPASTYVDHHQGTDLFVVKSNGETQKFSRVDLTEGHRATVVKKIRRSVAKSKNGGRWVKIVHLPREAVIGIATKPCFPRAYETFVAGRDMRDIALEQACPDHGNRCIMAKELFQLGRSLNSQLKRSFQMPVSNPPLPSLR